MLPAPPLNAEFYKERLIMLDNFQLHELSGYTGLERISYLLEILISSKTYYDYVLDSYEQKDYEKNHFPDIIRIFFNEYRQIEPAALLKVNYGIFMVLGENTKAAIKVLKDLYYENKLSVSDDEINEMTGTLEELLSNIRNQENQVYRFKVSNLNESLSRFIEELQAFLDYILFFKDAKTEILETLSSAYSNYKSDLDSYNEQIMSDGYNKAVDETQDAIENENLKQKALSIISAIFGQKCYIENPELLEKTSSLVSQSKRIINDTLPLKISVKDKLPVVIR